MQFLSHTPVLLAMMIGVTRQAGFTPDQRVHAVVEHGRMIGSVRISVFKAG